MSKKLTTEEFIERAKSTHGDRYDYSKAEYVGGSKKVCIICKEHGEFWQNPRDHINGHGCPTCARISTIEKNSGENNKRRLTREEFIRKSREIHGDKYDYSKVEYVNANTKVCIICPVHGEFWIKPSNHLYGKKTGCAKCSHRTWNTEIFIEEAKKVHGDRYDYSKVEFKTVKDKVCIISKQKDRDGNEIGEFWQLPLEHINGRRYHKESDVYVGEKKEECWEVRTCPICGAEFKVRKKYEKITCSEECRRKYVEIHKEEIDKKRLESGRKTRAKWTDEFKKSIREKVKKTNLERYGVENYSELESERKRCSEKMKKQKHEWDIQYTQNVLIPKYRKICEDDDLELLEFRNRFDCLVKCKKCGDVFVTKTLGYLAEEHITKRCRHCHPIEQITGPTLFETSFGEFIKTLGLRYRKNCRSLITPQEIDYYFPDYNIGIELDGIYWHCELSKPKDYHLKKTMKCAEKGVRLIHIFEDEWRDKREICMSRVKNILGFTEKTLYARKCEVREVSKNDKSLFLKENHIQGDTVSKYNYGLYSDGNLVSLMTFGNLRKNLGSERKEGSYELLRFCNKMGTTVVGGASKLLEHFKRELNPEVIISYCDLRWSNGELYEKIGFTLDHVSKPNYSYVINADRKNRFSFRKSVLVEKFGCPTDMSEHDFCFSNRWYRIYDCGNKVYKYYC